MNYPKVFIIILNWNGLKDTLECLESVFKIDYPSFEVIVVDNGSTDNSADVISKTYPRVILIENKENLGFTGGNNVAMGYAMQSGADYMWLLNNDTIVEPDTLSKIVATAGSHKEIGLVSPVIYYYDKPDKIQFCGSYVDWMNQTIVYPEDKDHSMHDDFRIGENVCLWGTALLIKKNVVKKIGYLKEDFFAYWEDTEYSMRVLKAGYRNLMSASAKVYHKTAPPLPGVIRRGTYYFYYMIRNQYFLGIEYFKNHGRWSFFWGYLSDVLTMVRVCNHCNVSEAGDACLDGAWAGIHGIGGPWDRAVKMPRWLKKVFYFLSSWHPYFWVNLFQGNFSHIISEVYKRTRAKIKTKVG